MTPTGDIVMEGYLYKRSSNALRKWNRRWFQIRDAKLIYSHRFADVDMPTVMEENLMLCLVRPAPSSIDRPACFELVTPTRSHLLQANSEDQRNLWMRAIQTTILQLHESHQKSGTLAYGGIAVGGTSYGGAGTTLSGGATSYYNSSKSSPMNAPSGRLYEKLRRDPANRLCADCRAADPKWVSINLGAILCIECAGLHRSLGTHVSKVRSLTMDSFAAETAEMLTEMGNELGNGVFLAYLPVAASTSFFPPPVTPTCSRETREAWIRAKYVDRRFGRRPQASVERTMTTEGAVKRNVERTEGVVTRSMTRSRGGEGGHADGGAEIRWRTGRIATGRNNNVDCSEGRTADERHTKGYAVASLPCSVKAAAAAGDLKALLTAVVEGADLDARIDGETALHVAVRKGQTSATELLLLNGANWNGVDDHGNTPLHVAAEEGKTLGVCQLLRRDADSLAVNAAGATPLQLAIDAGHADIVTIFRVHSNTTSAWSRPSTTSYAASPARLIEGVRYRRPLVGSL